MTEKPNKEERLVKRGLRWSRSMLDRTICHRILQATFSTVNPVIIKNVTMAVRTVEKQAEQAKIEGLDFELFQKIDKLYSSFRNANSYRDSESKQVFYIPWNFERTLENFKTYIEPWYKHNLEFWQGHIKRNLTVGRRVYHNLRRVSTSCTQRLTVFNPTEGISYDDHINYVVPDFCPKCGHSIYCRDLSYENVLVINYNAPKWALFFEASGCLTQIGYDRLKTAFESWALDHVAEAFNILSNWVSPSTYDEMLKVFKGIQENKGEKQGNENYMG
jgi:hypothetical protein